MSRGVGVNEVRRCPSSLRLAVRLAIDATRVNDVCFVFWLCFRLFVVLLFPAVWQQFGHGGVPLPEPGPEPGHPVGPGIKEKYSPNTLTGFFLVMSQRAELKYAHFPVISKS